MLMLLLFGILYVKFTTLNLLKYVKCVSAKNNCR